MSSYSGNKSPDASAESQASQDSTIEDEVASLTIKVDTRFKEVDSRFNSLENKLDQFMSMFAHLLPSKEETQKMETPLPGKAQYYDQPFQTSQDAQKLPLNEPPDIDNEADPPPLLAESDEALKPEQAASCRRRS